MTTRIAIVAPLGQAVAQRARRHLSARSILSRVITDGTTTLEVWVPPVWPSDHVHGAIQTALVRSGAHNWQVQAAEIEVLELGHSAARDRLSVG